MTISSHDGTVFYTPADGRIENCFVKQESVIKYMFDKYKVGNGLPLTRSDVMTLEEQMWDVVMILLHNHENWMHTLHGHFIFRPKNQMPIVFTSKNDILEFFCAREMRSDMSAYGTWCFFYNCVDQKVM